MRNILTIDLEDWYHVNYKSLKDTDNKINKNSSNLEEIIDEILALLNKFNYTATFFVLGEVARKIPKKIIEIEEEGHEIASHGYKHDLVYTKDKEFFLQDIKRSKIILENICKKRINGYRAPSWSIDKIKTPWFKKILECEKFSYDSSIFPVKTYLYGDNKTPIFTHKLDNLLLEIPPTVYNILKIRIPFSGGFYFRIIPYFLIKHFTKKINTKFKKPVVFYFHPREFSDEQYLLPLSLKDNFIQYFNVKRVKDKFIRLCNDFVFCSINEYTNFET